MTSREISTVAPHALSHPGRCARRQPASVEQRAAGGSARATLLSIAENRPRGTDTRLSPVPKKRRGLDFFTRPHHGPSGAPPPPPRALPVPVPVPHRVPRGPAGWAALKQEEAEDDKGAEQEQQAGEEGLLGLLGPRLPGDQGRGGHHVGYKLESQGEHAAQAGPKGGPSQLGRGVGPGARPVRGWGATRGSRLSTRCAAAGAHRGRARRTRGH
mmetsp:Transcript_20879/g.70094  ORF Transcript_20879/g.70094 Transcript_20879/m.70094 type:complete len:214 (+) Transcript_20879:289-930(+)